MEEALVAYLLADTALAALVATRIYWVEKPQAVVNPVMVLTRISGNRNYHMLGAANFVESRVQFDCDGLTYASAKGVARALRDRLSGFRGTQGTIAFYGCFIDSERDTFDEAPTTDKLFRTSLDFIIHHKET